MRPVLKNVRKANSVRSMHEAGTIIFDKIPVLSFLPKSLI